MAAIPLEDGFSDILGKTQRGLKLSDQELSARSGVTVGDIVKLRGGTVAEPALRKVAAALGLSADALVALANKSYAPLPREVHGLAQFNTPYEDFTVNAYLAWDRSTGDAVLFDTGATAEPVLQFCKQHGLKIRLILLTHTHPDHIADLARVKEVTGAPAWVGAGENFADAQAFAEGKTFEVGSLSIETRQTSGHAAGGITFVVHGLEVPVAVVGDALFAGSMGGGMISFGEALENNRKKLFTLPDDTIVASGHGPLTTLGEEKANNPFYPEFQTNNQTSAQKGKAMAERIGFVGVGRMGANMARRLKESGFPVTAVYDVRAESATTLAKEIGAEACASLARVTALSDVIITVVTDDKAMLKIFAAPKKGGDSLLAGAKGKLFINCATLSPQVHVDVEKLAKKAGAASLEACMASSITQARQGTLYLMLGGSEKTFEKAKPVLEKLAASLRYVGKTGQAAVVKALVNMVMNINTAGLAEGLGLGAAHKLDLAMLREIFSQTGANSRVLQTDGEDMQNRDHSCFFSASHAAKDSGIALALAKKQGLNLPLASAALGQFNKMVKAGLGELDKSGVAELTFKGRGKKKK